jgi:hypothetical protein
VFDTAGTILKFDHSSLVFELHSLELTTAIKLNVYFTSLCKRLSSFLNWEV